MSHGVGHAQVIHRGEAGELPPEPVWGDPVDQDTDNTEHSYNVGTLASGENLHVYAAYLPTGFKYEHPNLILEAGTEAGSYSITNMIFAWNGTTVPCPPFTWNVSGADIGIVQQPQDTEVDEPQGTSFTCVGSHPDGVHYKWLARRVGDTEWLDPRAVLSDVQTNSITQSTLIINSTSLEDIENPIISVQPQDREVIEPLGTTFTCTASHPDGVHYEWFARVVGSDDWLDPSDVLSDVNVASITQNVLRINSSET